MLDSLRFTYGKYILVHVVWILVSSILTGGYGQDKCKQSLGLSNSSIIKDEQFSCSSFLYDYVARAYHYRPYHGRLHGTEGAGAWCSSDKLRGEYLQVDFLRNTVVTYVETQGRYRGAEYTGKYKVAYLRDADKTWKIVRNGKGEEQIFIGNNDTDTVKGNYLPYPIIARKVRLVPMGDLFSIHCIRMEMYGCSWNKGQLRSYSAPLGTERGRYDFRDLGYDGNTDKTLGLLTNGFGALADGILGSTDLSTGWVGYRGSPVVVTFYFKEIRLFHSATFNVRSPSKVQSYFKSMEVQKCVNDKDFIGIRNLTKWQMKSNELYDVDLLSVETKCLRFLFHKKAKQILLIGEVDFKEAAPIPPTTKLITTTPRATKRIPTHRKVDPTDGNRGDSNNVNEDVTSSTYSRESSKSTRYPGIPSNDAAAQKDSGRTKSFYVIVGIATAIAVVFAFLIALLIYFLRRDKKDDKAPQKISLIKRGSDVTKVSEPLLKSTDFQGVAGTSRYMTPDMVHLQGFPAEKEIPRTAIDFDQRIGGGKYGEIFVGQVICPREGSMTVSMQTLIGQKVFIEVLKKGATVDASVQFYDEVRALACLRHPNICRLAAVCTKNEPMYVVTENIDGMRLDKFLKTLTHSNNKIRRSDLLKEIVVRVSSALKYISSIMFVHRDISARNILYGGGDLVKLTNTAASCAGYYDCYYYLKEKNGLYPVRWMAPESLGDFTFTVQSDVWSFGILLWEMYTFSRIRPMDLLADGQVVSQLRELCKDDNEADIDLLPFPNNCPSFIYNIMRRCWMAKPRDRVSADEIYDTLQR